MNRQQLVTSNRINQREIQALEFFCQTQNLIMFQAPIQYSYQDKENPEKHQDLFECLICNQYYADAKMGCISECSHNFCSECLKYYITYRIKNQFALIQCPREGCTSAMDIESKMFQELNPELQSRYKKIMENISILRSKIHKTCPECVLELEKSDKEEYLFCTKCLIKYCPKCLCKYHPRYKDCEKYIVQFMKHNYNFRRCAKCLFMIEKKQGCMHMTCVCGYQFCYNCGGDWKNGNHTCPEYRKIKPLIYHTINRVIPEKQVLKMNVINLAEQNLGPQGIKNQYEIDSYFNMMRQKIHVPTIKEKTGRQVIKNCSMLVDHKH